MEDKNIIKVGDKIFNSSKYQQDIFTQIEQGCNNIVITACAGSAKSTTIENCLRFIPNKEKKLFLAFNVSTVEKIKNDVGEKNSFNTSMFTFHGLGNRILRENDIINDTTIIDDFKYIRYIKNNLNILSENYINLNNLSLIYKNNIIKLIDYSRYYLAMTEREIKKVAEIYGIIPIKDEFSIVRKVLLWGKNNLQSIDNTDMIWLPNELNLETKCYKYDYIFIDEAQDTTIAHQSMVDKCFKRSTRFVAVGDLRQQINVWCGATAEAIHNYENRENTISMPLPISYRCPKKIIEKAKYYSQDIEAAENAIDGEIRYDVSINDAKSGDMILCRVISKLVEAMLKLLRNNKKVYLKGNEEVKKSCLEIINQTNCNLIDLNCELEDGLINQLYSIYFNLQKKYIQEFNIDEEDVMYHHELVNMYDNIECIKVISEGLTTVQELIDKINIIFSGDEKDAIILSTVHKAKGLEANNIFILCPSLMANALSQKEWERNAEINLNYVAITRAKKSLNYIKEDKKGFMYNFHSSKSMKKDIDQMKKSINLKSEPINEPISEPINTKGNSKFKLCNLIKK